MPPLLSLSGPARRPASGLARRLVVLLHGLGADGNDLIGLAPVLSQVLPDAAFVAPNAPFPCDMAPFGYQWFSVQDRTPERMLAGVRLAAGLLDAYVDEQLEALRLGADRLAFVGFSQGTMMALHVALRRPAAPACVVGFSGRLIAPELLAEEAVSKPPVLLVHGDADEVVPHASLAHAEQALAAAGVPVEAHTIRGLGHGIEQQGLTLAATFLVRHLGRA